MNPADLIINLRPGVDERPEKPSNETSLTLRHTCEGWELTFPLQETRRVKVGLLLLDE